MAAEAGPLGLFTHRALVRIPRDEALESSAAGVREATPITLHHADDLAWALGDGVAPLAYLQQVEHDDRAVGKVPLL